MNWCAFLLFCGMLASLTIRYSQPELHVVARRAAAARVAPAADEAYKGGVSGEKGRFAGSTLIDPDGTWRVTNRDDQTPVPCRLIRPALGEQFLQCRSQMRITPHAEPVALY